MDVSEVIPSGGQENVTTTESDWTLDRVESGVDMSRGAYEA